jgi:hypothetical protein
MHPRLAEARKVEAMEAIPTRLDHIEAAITRLAILEEKLDRILDLLTAPKADAPSRPTFTQPPAKGR